MSSLSNTPVDRIPLDRWADSIRWIGPFRGRVDRARPDRSSRSWPLGRSAPVHFAGPGYAPSCPQPAPTSAAQVVKGTERKHPIRGVRPALYAASTTHFSPPYPSLSSLPRLRPCTLRVVRARAGGSSSARGLPLTLQLLAFLAQGLALALQHQPLTLLPEVGEQKSIFSSCPQGMEKIF